MPAATPLGQEPWFSSLLNGDMDPVLLARFRRFDAQSMLDLGCGEGLALVCCHYTLGLSHLEGVEQESRTAIDQKYQTKPLPTESGLPICSLEEHWGRFVPNEADAIPIAKTPAELRALLQITYNTRAEAYKPLLAQYDIIVLSHMLHYLVSEAQVQNILDKVTQLSHEGTLVYLSVKPDSTFCGVPGRRFLALCRAFAGQLKLCEYKGPFSQSEGQAYIFTNL